VEPETVAAHLNEPDEALYRLISLAARDLRRGMQPALREWGVTGQQFGGLLGAAQGASIAAVAEQLLTDPTSAGRIVERMEAAKLVERYQRPDDRRVVWVRLLPDGAELLERCLPLHAKRAREMLGPLTDDERETLSRLLNKVRSYLAAGASATTE